LLLFLWEWITWHRLDKPLGALLLLAWMVSLSWGYPLPNLVAGSLVLGAVYVLASEGIEATVRRRYARAGLVSSLVLASVFITVSVQARRAAPYFERPAEQLTASLSSISPRFGSIRTNPTTFDYLRAIKLCVLAHPAHWTAVLPDNPGVYPALRLNNPFPIDWMFPDETRGEEGRILQRARLLDRQGNYLILFQTVSAQSVALLHRLPTAATNAALFDYGGHLTNEILQALHGERVTCGPFVGSYSPE